MEYTEVQFLDSQEISTVAEELSVATLPEQMSMIDRIFANSMVAGVKVAVETIEIIKKANDSTIKGNKQFVTLCDKGIDTLQTSISDGNLSEEEKKDVRNKIMDILKMANDSNQKSMDFLKDSIKEVLKEGGKIFVGLGALRLLYVIEKAIVKSFKK